MEKIRLHDLDFVPYISRQAIADRIEALAADIDRDYAGRMPTFVVVLNGAFMFGSDLIKACTVACEVYFVKLSSYQGTQSTGQIMHELDLSIDAAGRDIIIVEDIVDTGHTMHHYLEQLWSEGPNSIAVATMLVKREAMQHDLDLAYCGFEIKNRFVVGYGLDYEQRGRELDSIWVLAE